MDPSDLTVTITAGTDEFQAAIDDAIDKVEELEAALERLNETDVTVTIETDGVSDRDEGRAAGKALSRELRSSGFTNGE